MNFRGNQKKQYFISLILAIYFIIGYSILPVEGLSNNTPIIEPIYQNQVYLQPIPLDIITIIGIQTKERMKKDSEGPPIIVPIIEEPKVVVPAVESKPTPVEQKSKENKVVVEKEVEESLSEGTHAFYLTGEEREILVRLVHLEGRGESVAAQKGITSVILNRLKSGKWGNTLREVIYAKGQFTPAKQISSTIPNSEIYAVVDDVIQNGTTMPSNILYFSAGSYFHWRNYVGYKVIDNTYFGYVK